jgi:hypothetical protein
MLKEEEEEIGRACNMHGRRGNAYQMVEKLDRKRPIC